MVREFQMILEIESSIEGLGVSVDIVCDFDLTVCTNFSPNLLKHWLLYKCEYRTFLNGKMIPNPSQPNMKHGRPELSSEFHVIEFY